MISMSSGIDDSGIRNRLVTPFVSAQVSYLDNLTTNYMTGSTMLNYIESKFILSNYLRLQICSRAAQPPLGVPFDAEP